VSHWQLAPSSSFKNCLTNEIKFSSQALFWGPCVADGISLLSTY
jgi:hypothetical protein